MLFKFNQSRPRFYTPGPFLLICAFLAGRLAAPLASQEPDLQDAPPGAVARVFAPCDASLSSRLRSQASQAEQSKDFETAARLFREAWKACPDRSVDLAKASQALTQQRRFEEAADTAREVLRQEPNSIPGLLALANSLFMSQRWQEAEPIIERVLLLDPDNSAALLLKGNNQYLLGDSSGAEQTFLKLLDHEPKNEVVAYILGRIYYMENRAEYALGQFQRVLRLNPKSYKAWDNLGLCYQALGEEKKAIGAFLEAIKIVEEDHPDYDWPYANLADLFLTRNEPQLAYQAVTKAAKRNPFSARNFYLGGKSLWKLGRIDDAIQWLERSVQLDENYPEPLYLLGQIYIRTGKREKGMEIVRRFREVKKKAPKERR